MAIRTQDQIKNAVLVRNNRTTTDGFISDDMLSNFFLEAHNWASGFQEWPFLDAKQSTTWATEETQVFEGFRPDSTKFLTVGGKRYQKMNFDDYLTHREFLPDDEQRIFSDFGNTYYINPNGASGTLVAYAQYQPYIDVTDGAATTIFSERNDDGNEAIVEYMTAMLKRREHLPDEAVLHEQMGEKKLLTVWNRVSKEQTNYHTATGMFRRIDITNSGHRFRHDQFRRDQF